MAVCFASTRRITENGNWGFGSFLTANRPFELLEAQRVAPMKAPSTRSQETATLVSHELIFQHISGKWNPCIVSPLQAMGWSGVLGLMRRWSSLPSKLATLTARFFTALRMSWLAQMQRSMAETRSYRLRARDSDAHKLHFASEAPLSSLHILSLDRAQLAQQLMPCCGPTQGEHPGFNFHNHSKSTRSLVNDHQMWHHTLF